MHTESGLFTLKTYYITRELKLNWTSANEYCNEKGMSFVTFETNEEAEYFNSISGNQCWVGITDVARRGTFMQVSGVISPNLPWTQGQPSNSNDEDCVTAGYQSGFNDDKCFQLRRFACEKYSQINMF